MIYDMKKAILTLAILLAICTVCVAQRQKVTVGKDGEMIVNGDTVAYIEKEGCKLLSATCRFIVTDLKAANDRVRQLLTERNDERSAQIMGELKAAREATDRAYLTLVRLTNAYALLNPGVESAQKLVALVSEDLEYFRKHAMAPSHRDKKTPEPDAEPATQGETPAEA